MALFLIAELTCTFINFTNHDHVDDLHQDYYSDEFDSCEDDVQDVSKRENKTTSTKV